MENCTNIEFDKYLNYWLKLFPEINNDKKQLYSLYNSCTKENLEHSLNKKFKLVTMEELDEEYSDEFLNNISKLKKEKTMPFVEAFMPILSKSYRNIMAEIKKYDFLYDKSVTLTDFIYCLYSNIYQIACRMCIKELRRSKLSNELKGNNEEEEFNYYTSSLLNDKEYLLRFYHTYPSLWYTLKNKAEYFTDFFIEVLRNIDINKENLIDLYLDGDDKNFKLTKLNIGAGDSHKKGRSVVILNFTNDYRIVYKPRSLSIDNKFKEFCDFINSQDIPGYLNLQNPIIYTKDDYGFVSFVKYKPCNNKQELNNYYHRIGELLALLYLFDAKDCHHENIIAHGDMPIIIDLETLFHGSLMEYTNDKEESLLENSVLETLLLPRKMKMNNKTDKVLDIGGVGAFKEQECPIPVPTVINSGRSDMKIIYTHPIIETEANVPKISTEEISNVNIENINEISSGFSILYDWINSNKTLVERTVLKLFKNVECRLILHATNYYATLQRLGNHPDLNDNPINKEVFLCKVGLNNINNKGKLLNSYEHRDLLEEDIPYFTNVFQSRNIFDSHCNKVTNVKLIRSPEENFKRRLLSICPKDKKLQLDLIYWSFVNLLPVSQCTKDYSKASKVKYTRKELINIAKDIGKVIMDNSIIFNNNCTWLGMEFDGKTEESSYVDTMSADLYKGLAGVALFFNTLYKITNLNEYELYTRVVCHQLVTDLESLTVSKLKNLSNRSIRIGGFIGLGSTLYSIYKIAETLSDYYYHKVVIDTITAIDKSNIINDDTNKDILGGVSGYIMVLLSIYEKEKDTKTKEKLKKIILNLRELIIDRSKIDEEGYTGFAHGTSGAIAVLIRLNHHFKDSKNIESIKKMLNHERNLFDRESQNWFIKENEDTTAFAWCNGACGVLLSRVLLKKYNYTDELIDFEIKTSLNHLLTSGFGNNMSLCHGDTGNALILKEYLSVFKDNEVERYFEDICYKIADEIKNSKSKKMYRNIDLYGLMTGKSGDGYFLLNLVDRELDNILFLQ